MNYLFISKNLKIIIKLLPIFKIQLYQDEIVFFIKKNYLISTLIFLKKHINFQFKLLTCISGVDYPHNKNRFNIVYELLSIRYNIRIRIKVLINELKCIESCNNVFTGASWYESEIWDMYGLFFRNHINLIRLLTDYGFEGYPLRKDFPLNGFVESTYNYAYKRVIHERVELSHEYRVFEFTSPWEVINFS